MHSDLFRYLARQFFERCFAAAPWGQFVSDPELHLSEQSNYECWVLVNKPTGLLALVDILRAHLKEVDSTCDLTRLLVYSGKKDYSIEAKTLLFIDFRSQLIGDMTRNDVLNTYQQRLPNFIEKCGFKFSQINVFIVYREFIFQENPEKPITSTPMSGSQFSIIGEAQLNIEGLYKQMFQLSDINVLTLAKAYLKVKEELEALKNPSKDAEKKPNWDTYK